MVSSDWQPRPKRPYTAVDAPGPGNLVSVTHGAWSARLVAETEEELRPALQAIVDAAGWIQAVDVLALEGYLHDWARLVRLQRWLQENGDRYTSGKRAGELRDRDLREVASLQRRCLDHRRALLLDPASRARARVDRRALDLAAEWMKLDDDDSGETDEEVDGE